MNWATVVLTAPRPEPTLERTLTSLRRAGWPDCLVSEDPGSGGQFPAWIEALKGIVRRRPDADAYLVIEDDVVFCRELREYIERTLWPDEPNKVALCSPYSPAVYRVERRGWNRQQRGFHLVGALTWILPPNAARDVLRDLSSLVGTEASLRGADYLVGDWAAKTRRTVWYHTPSLAQHLGLRNSARGDDAVGPMRRADDFIGEEAAP
ncbi:MAG TPA: hypothetical protein VMY42_26640 [Thermoguttaceae bacterium]|nr:hypothetical protein [Thermoguttaceae bacterium]